MAKPFRSPLVGYNHNLSHLGRVFHVQSEDSGPASPRLFTHLFYEGTILVSRKQAYDPILTEDKVRILMRTQHKEVILDLTQARLDERIIAFFTARGERLVPGPGAVQGVEPGTVHGIVPGALPSAPLMTTPGPVVLMPSEAAQASEATEVSEVSEVSEDAEISEVSEVSEGDHTIPVESLLADAVAEIAADDIPPDDVEDESLGSQPGDDQAAAAGVATTSGEASREGKNQGRDGGRRGRQTEVWGDAPPRPESPGSPESSEASAPAVPPPAQPRRRSTRPMESFSARGVAPNPIVVRPPEASRATFVRSEPPAAASKVTSGDAVVVHRSVVVGGKAPAPRAPRGRSQVPYVVTGAGDGERTSRPAPDGSAKAATDGGASTAATRSSTAGAPAGAAESGRPPAGFGVGRTDDKSLDEVILEYLSDDGEPG